MKTKDAKTLAAGQNVAKGAFAVQEELANINRAIAEAAKRIDYSTYAAHQIHSTQDTADFSKAITKAYPTITVSISYTNGAPRIAIIPQAPVYKYIEDARIAEKKWHSNTLFPSVAELIAFTYGYEALLNTVQELRNRIKENTQPRYPYPHPFYAYMR